MAKTDKITEEIEIPSDVEVAIDSLNNSVKIKGSKGEVERKFIAPKISIELKDKKVVISAKKIKKFTKREKKLIYTIKSHIENMINGVKEGFIYKLQICSVHFPMTASVDKSRNVVAIKNFLGEAKERTAKILPDVSVKIEKDIINVESCNIESAGQTAANIEATTRIRARDKRIFQDGIYIISKAGGEI